MRIDRTNADGTVTRKSWRDISAEQLLEGVEVPREIRAAFLHGDPILVGIQRVYGGRFGAPSVPAYTSGIAVRRGDGSPMARAIEAKLRPYPQLLLLAGAAFGFLLAMGKKR